MMSQSNVTRIVFRDIHITHPNNSMSTAMNRIALILTKVCLVCASLNPSTAIAKKPNVLFIVCDDLNTHVSTSGYPVKVMCPRQ
ncbi:hypothetical protein Poly51_58610 [Rubripirellula tenax]|uniref:Uncharacterized protein n=1 Tax=Rubripirellula tenax TaxID=2528015 RepID=A0A5C6E8F7_9BACT|nr:hypothetical protein Poly51_58610 [Rubripirellula tenax]